MDELLEGLRRRDRRSLARLLTLAARGVNIPGLNALRTHPSRVVAITGSAGVGKSTLVGKLIERTQADRKTIAVLACDPQSPLTGGALLGDRFRMGPARDDGVFIRSLATPAGHEAIAPHLPTMVRLLQAFGFDLILLETVGAGQTDTAVSRLADLVVLLLQPETGDDLQWEKAGVLEVADLLVIHKGDLPGAERTLGQVKAALELSMGRDVPVFLVSSQTGQGIDELYARMKEMPAVERRRSLQAMLRSDIEERLSALADDAEYRAVEDAWRKGDLDDQAAKARMWHRLGARRASEGDPMASV